MPLSIQNQTETSFPTTDQRFTHATTHQRWSALFHAPMPHHCHWQSPTTTNRRNTTTIPSSPQRTDTHWLATPPPWTMEQAMATAPPPIPHNSTKLQTKTSPMVQSNPQNNVATMARHVDWQMQRQTQPQHWNQSCSRTWEAPMTSDPTLWMATPVGPRKTKILQNSTDTSAEMNTKQIISMGSIVGTPHHRIISRPRTRLDGNSACCPPCMWSPRMF